MTDVNLVGHIFAEKMIACEQQGTYSSARSDIANDCTVDTGRIVHYGRPDELADSWPLIFHLYNCFLVNYQPNNFL